MSRHASKFAAVVVLAAACVAIIGSSSFNSTNNEANAQTPAQRGGDMKNMQGGKDMKDMPGMRDTTLVTGQPGTPAVKEVTKAVCVLTPLGDSKVKGKVTFTKVADGVQIEAELSGLSPGDHGFHIHEFGDISSADGMSAGGHFNPTGVAHGNFDAAARHQGDFGNLTADAQGNAKYSRVDKVATLSGANSILGRSMIVHANKDDFSQPTGNAGGRIANGVIGVANAAPPATGGK